MITNTFDSRICFWQPKHINTDTNRKRLVEKHKYAREHQAEMNERVSAIYNARHQRAVRREKFKRLREQFIDLSMKLAATMLQGLGLAILFGLFGWVGFLLFLMDDDE